MTTRALKLRSAWTRKLKLPESVKVCDTKKPIPEQAVWGSTIPHGGIKWQRSSLEEQFALQVRAAKLPEPKREYRFSKRRWRFDFAWTPQCVAVELAGGTYTQGRHTRGRGYANDRCKSNEAQLLGWLVIEATAEHVKTGKALEWVERAING